MNKYTMYRFGIFDTARLIRKKGEIVGFSKKDIQEMSDTALTCKFLEMTGLTGVMSELLLTVVENAFLESNREVYFFESKELIQNLNSTKFKVEGFMPPEGIRMVVPPKHTFVDGIELQPCLVTVNTFEQRNQYTKDLNKYLKRPITYHKQLDSPEKALAIFLNVGPKTKRMTYFLNIPIERIGRLMKATTLAQYKKVVGELDPKDGYTKLTEEETRLQWVMTKVIISLFVYESAFPDTIKKGMHIKTNMKSNDFDQKEVTTHSKFKTRKVGEVGFHYRSSFFRTLTHEKYYQGIHAHLERGSRVTLVPATMVNEKDKPVEAYTVTESASLED